MDFNASNISMSSRKKQAAYKIRLSPNLRKEFTRAMNKLYRIYSDKPYCDEAKNAYQHLSIFLENTK